jgi:hypothetical protein
MTIEQTVQIAGLLSDVQFLIEMDKNREARRLLNKAKRDLFEIARKDASTELELKVWLESKQAFFTEEDPDIMDRSGRILAKIEEAKAGIISQESLKIYLKQIQEDEYHD